jgi:hypothetical protein
MAKTKKQTQKSSTLAGLDDTQRQNFECAKRQLGAQRVLDVEAYLPDALYIEQEYRKGRQQGRRAIAQAIEYYDAAGRVAGSADALMTFAHKIKSFAEALDRERESSYGA